MVPDVEGVCSGGDGVRDTYPSSHCARIPLTVFICWQNSTAGHMKQGAMWIADCMISDLFWLR